MINYYRRKVHKFAQKKKRRHAVEAFAVTVGVGLATYGARKVLKGRMLKPGMTPLRQLVKRSNEYQRIARLRKLTRR